jgi:hypothetical protein
MDSDVTFVATSCGRQDLLEITLDSFLRFNTYPIREYLITEDSAVPGINDRLKKKYAQLPITWIEEPRKRGQLECIDDAYSRVKTRYIFHCEDDWEFYRPNFIEPSKSILHNCRGALQVWIRAENDTGGHPLDSEVHFAFRGDEQIEYRRVQYNYFSKALFHGFSFNPGLRRLKDYLYIGGKYAPYWREHAIAEAYKARMYSAVILTGPGYVRHIGDERHVYDAVQKV